MWIFCNVQTPSLQTDVYVTDWPPVVAGAGTAETTSEGASAFSGVGGWACEIPADNMVAANNRSIFIIDFLA
jgi:hypothetical protein